MIRGMKECLKLIVRYEARYGAGNVTIRHSRIASEVGSSERSVRRWLKKLETEGHILVTRCGPHASEYACGKSGQSLASLWPVKAALSLTEFRTEWKRKSGGAATVEKVWPKPPEVAQDNYPDVEAMLAEDQERPVYDRHGKLIPQFWKRKAW